MHTAGNRHLLMAQTFRQLFSHARKKDMHILCAHHRLVVIGRAVLPPCQALTVDCGACLLRSDHVDLEAAAAAGMTVAECTGAQYLPLRGPMQRPASALHAVSILQCVAGPSLFSR